MNYIIFGGSGFIGTHLIKLLKQECVKAGDKIYDLDIVMPGEEGVVPGVVEKIEGVEYVRLDVRKEIELNFQPTSNDIIFNLALQCIEHLGIQIMRILKRIYLVQRMLLHLQKNTT